MTKKKKIWLGIFTIAPTVLGIILPFVAFAFIPILINTDPDTVPWVFLAVIIALILLFSIWGLALLIYYIVHAIRSEELEDSMKILWVILFLFVGQICMPVYFFLQIWPEQKSEKKK